MKYKTVQYRQSPLSQKNSIYYIYLHILFQKKDWCKKMLLLSIIHLFMCPCVEHTCHSETKEEKRKVFREI